MTISQVGYQNSITYCRSITIYIQGLNSTGDVMWRRSTVMTYGFRRHIYVHLSNMKPPHKVTFCYPIWNQLKWKQISTNRPKFMHKYKTIDCIFVLFNSIFSRSAFGSRCSFAQWDTIGTVSRKHDIWLITSIKRKFLKATIWILATVHL